MNKLTEIDVRNFKRIRKARLVLDGTTFVISGDNGEGKSSFLDAIAALFGGQNLSPKVPVRKGAKEATIVGRLKTKDGRIFVANVTFTADGNRRLVVKDEAGATQASPQSLLSAFWAETSFDPSLFLASEAKEQVVMLKRLVGLDFSALDTERVQKFNERTNVNRDVDRQKAVAASLPQYPDAAKEEVSGASIVAKINEAQAHNAKRVPLIQVADAAKLAVDAGQSQHEQLILNAAEIRDDIRALEERLVVLRSEFDAANKASDTQAGAMGGLRGAAANAKKALDDFELIDAAPYTEQLAGLEEANRKVRANAQRAAAGKALREKQELAEKLTERIDEIDATKEEMLQKAPFPIPEMSLNENGVIYKGLPLEQASDSEKIAVGVEMAAVLNPDKPLMLVRNGNLFTPKNFTILDQIAEKRGLTCIVEVAGDARADTKLVFVDGVGIVPGEETAPEKQADLPMS